MDNAAGRMYRQVTQMQLINNGIDRIGKRRLVFRPACRIGLRHIQNGTPVTVNPYSPGIGVCRFVPLLPDTHPVSIKLALQITGHIQPPGTAHFAGHRQMLTFNILPGRVEHNLRLKGSRCP
ncbi:hypothetical protein D3C86_1890440 [compost metagenome]